ncbi:MAG: NUDIX hydrolase [Sphingosinicella sp.]|nr:NUDIX hydrolase [Sphingosinicella sp.]
MPEAEPLQQFGVLPYRLGAGGEIHILLITSRDTQRWVVPRGNPIDGLAPHQSAVQEAWEEAGIIGAVMSEPIGNYCYAKRKKDGSVMPAFVDLFPFQIDEQNNDWPERGERETRWFDREAAAEAVDEPDLKQLIRAFSPERG